MGIINRFFKKEASQPDEISAQTTIPVHLTAQEFGKIVVRKKKDEYEIEVTLAMEPQGKLGEGWQTGVAMDASSSMKDWYGRLLVGQVPQEIQAGYEKKGWIQTKKEDGRKLTVFEREAYEDAVKQGYLAFSSNIIQPLARNFISYLASNLDADGGTTVIYWACGEGDDIEVIGDLTEQQCVQMDMQGPATMRFGKETHLKPAMAYFIERFADAKRGMYIFITDGRIDDLNEVKRYTTELAQAIEAGSQNSVKCVLIGVGSKIDRKQLTELDDLETGTSVDIWDYKIADEMRSLIDIFAEVVEENQIVAPFGTISDSNGTLIKKYTDGLPAKLSFTMSDASDWFELEVSGRKIRQHLETM
jgi:hypothetical protein